MTAATKVSACVDCGTTIIGERPRCPACHGIHAAHVNRGSSLVRWAVAIEVLGIVVLAFVLLVKGCSS